MCQWSHQPSFRCEAPQPCQGFLQQHTDTAHHSPSQLEGLLADFLSLTTVALQFLACLCYLPGQTEFTQSRCHFLVTLTLWAEHPRSADSMGVALYTCSSIHMPLGALPRPGWPSSGHGRWGLTDTAQTQCRHGSQDGALILWGLMP